MLYGKNKYANGTMIFTSSHTGRTVNDVVFLYTNAVAACVQYLADSLEAVYIEISNQKGHASIYYYIHYLVMSKIFGGFVKILWPSQNI